MSSVLELSDEQLQKLSLSVAQHLNNQQSEYRLEC